MTSLVFSGVAPASVRGFCDVSSVTSVIPLDKGFQALGTSQNIYDLPDNLFVDGLIEDHKHDVKNSSFPVRPKFEKSVDCICHFFTLKGGAQSINLGRVSGQVIQNRNHFFDSVIQVEKVATEKVADSVPLQLSLVSETQFQG